MCSVLESQENNDMVEHHLDILTVLCISQEKLTCNVRGYMYVIPMVTIKAFTI